MRAAQGAGLRGDRRRSRRALGLAPAPQNSGGAAQGPALCATHTYPPGARRDPGSGIGLSLSVSGHSPAPLLANGMDISEEIPLNILCHKR